MLLHRPHDNIPLLPLHNIPMRGEYKTQGHIKEQPILPQQINRIKGVNGATGGQPFLHAQERDRVIYAAVVAVFADTVFVERHQSVYIQRFHVVEYDLR